MTLSLTGFGIGLRPQHYAAALENHEQLDFIEVISENFMLEGGRPLWVLDQMRERLPVALHGVSLSIGAADGLNRDYLSALKRLVDRVSPALVSDHLCWTGLGGVNTHDLLPLPLASETLALVCTNISVAQNEIGRAMLFENPSTYVAFEDDDMDEATFLAELCQTTGCGILLDINNVYVSAANHGFDAEDYLNRVNPRHVKQIHLAGHSQGKSMLIDTHDAPVCDAVWALYSAAVSRFENVPAMIERDGNIPDFDELMREVDTARTIAAAAGIAR